MDWKAAAEVGATVLISLGGAGAIIVSVSSYLGKTWASRILEKDKLRYQTELEKLKSDYQLDLEKQKNNFQAGLEQLKSQHQLELEKYKTTFVRYSETQFNLYNEIWVALYDLKRAMDTLWEEAHSDNLLLFAKTLDKSRHAVRRGAILIEESHYDQLEKLIDYCEEFQFEKDTLIKLRRSNELSRLNTSEIQEVIARNRDIRFEFTDLLNRVKFSFKRQLRGDHVEISFISNDEIDID